MVFLGFLGCLFHSSGPFVLVTWFPRSMFPFVRVISSFGVCDFGLVRIGCIGWSLRGNFPVRGLDWEASAIPW